MRQLVLCGWIIVGVTTIVAQDKPKPGGALGNKPADEAHAVPASKPSGIPVTVESLRLKLPDLPKNYRILLSSMRSGDSELQMRAEERQKFLELVAQYYVYRLTHDNLYTPDPGSGSLREHMDSLTKVVLPFAKSLEPDSTVPPDVTRRARQYAAELAKAFVPALLKVLQDPRPIVRINAMRMAYLFAERGIGEIHPVLLHPLEKYGVQASAVQHAEIYWAIRSFGELFYAVASNTDPKRVLLPPDVISRAAEHIDRWLASTYQFPPDVVRTWSEEEIEGLRFMRRQAIRSLAFLRQPLRDPNNLNSGSTAHLFLAVMKADPASKLSPVPSWSERVEAACGLMALLPDPKGAYQVDYAFYEVGHFVADLVQQANAGFGRNREPWQHYAAHLRSRLMEVQKHPSYAKLTYVQKLLSVLAKPLEELSRARDVTKPIDISPLTKFLDSQSPKVAQLFALPAKQ